MGILVELPTYVFGNNKSVFADMSMPQSVLKKKSSSIAYHYVCEGVVKDAWLTVYLHTDSNTAIMGRKSLPGGIKRTKFTSYLLHYVE